jgi:hypothetical protein
LSSSALTFYDVIQPIHAFNELCQSICLAVEACSEHFDEECVAYDKAASSEEERTSLLFNVLSANADTNDLALHEIYGEEKVDAIHR